MCSYEELRFFDNNLAYCWIDHKSNDFLINILQLARNKKILTWVLEGKNIAYSQFYIELKIILIR